MKGKWLSVQQAADYLGVARTTIYKWSRQGRLPIYKLGERVSRVRLEDLEALLAEAGMLYNVKPHAGKKTGVSRETILKKTKGAWADNPEIEQALAELHRSWDEWAGKS